jgi:hypothetical protein
MAQAKKRNADTMRPEYKRSDFPAGFVRGKYAARLAVHSNVVLLKPEIAAAFPTSEAVNAALSGLLRKAKAKRSSSRTRVK